MYIFLPIITIFTHLFTYLFHCASILWRVWPKNRVGGPARLAKVFFCANAFVYDNHLVCGDRRD